ncbi:MAG: BatA and WFA domain-containing protein, partial [Deltaproteobacteria bacterium]|nr:BatA and WFA domain-containing protein [Deltaproteobacteria bacterium]
MSFSGFTFAFLAKIFGLFGGLIALMYLLKMRERLVPVSAHFLWEKILKSGQRSLIARLLRRFFSFLLQLLILGFILFAMSNPSEYQQKKEPKKTVILLDQSASMLTNDISAGKEEFINRWSKALQEVRKIIKNKDPKEEISLVTFSHQAIPRVSWQKDPKDLLGALEKLLPHHTPGNIISGLRYAVQVLHNFKKKKIILVTDGAYSLSNNIFWPPVEQEKCKPKNKKVDLTGIELELVQIQPQKPVGNVGITAFSARPLPTDSEVGQVLIEVTNFSAKPRRISIKFYVDENWRATRNLTIEAGDRITRIIRLPLIGRHLQAVVKSMDGFEDKLELDNQAWSILPRKPDPRIMLVSEHNLFLEAALLLIPGYFEKVLPAEYTPELVKDCGEIGGAPCNFVIYNDFVPAKIPATPNQFYINPQGQPFKVKSQIEKNLQILWTGGANSHPIMENVSMKDVNLWGVSSSFVKEKGDKSLMQVDARGTIFSLLKTKKDGRRMLGLGFSLKDSDFVLQVSFPVFILNMVNWFMGTSPSFLATYSTGEPNRFFVDSDLIKYPDGSKAELSGKNLVFIPKLSGV